MSRLPSILSRSISAFSRSVPGKAPHVARPQFQAPGQSFHRSASTHVASPIKGTPAVKFQKPSPPKRVTVRQPAPPANVLEEANELSRAIALSIARPELSHDSPQEINLKRIRLSELGKKYPRRVQQVPKPPSSSSRGAAAVQPRQPQSPLNPPPPPRGFQRSGDTPKAVVGTQPSSLHDQNEAFNRRAGHPYNRTSQQQSSYKDRLYANLRDERIQGYITQDKHDEVIRNLDRLSSGQIQELYRGIFHPSVSLTQQPSIGRSGGFRRSALQPRVIKNPRTGEPIKPALKKTSERGKELRSPGLLRGNKKQVKFDIPESPAEAGYSPYSRSTWSDSASTLHNPSQEKGVLSRLGFGKREKPSKLSFSKEAAEAESFYRMPKHSASAPDELSQGRSRWNMWSRKGKPSKPYMQARSISSTPNLPREVTHSPYNVPRGSASAPNLHDPPPPPPGWGTPKPDKYVLTVGDPSRPKPPPPPRGEILKSNYVFTGRGEVARPKPPPPPPEFKSRQVEPGVSWGRFQEGRQYIVKNSQDETRTVSLHPLPHPSDPGYAAMYDRHAEKLNYLNHPSVTIEFSRRL